MTGQQTEQPKPISVAELFQNDQYIIPIYQRNYAWGAAEVEQLLQDVVDMAGQDSNGTGVYFLGSLVVHKRSDGHFETIDGQQRHTTLSIVLAAFKTNHPQQLETVIPGWAPNLYFDSRPKSTQTLQALSTQQERMLEYEEPAMRSAFNVILKFLEKPEVKALEDRFIQYLLKNVQILRITVPSGTDLNHYFEIMNNRGEQLEKHEVLKARLMGKLPGVDGVQTVFASIWDACVEMERYVAMCFVPEVRKALFGEALECCPKDFYQISKCLAVENDKSDSQSLSYLIENPEFKKDSKSKPSDQEESAFSSIINFPNFLLQVLRIATGKPVVLDDKKLLDTFEEHIATDVQVREFVVALLKCRLLFDRFIIKRKNDEKWTLRGMTPYESGSHSDTNSFDETLNPKLVMLLSMFHVSFPGQPRKYWLAGALAYLNQVTETGLKFDGRLQVNGNDYFNYLERMSKNLFFGRFYTQDPLEYDDLIKLDCEISSVSPTLLLNDRCLHRGTVTQNFIFNRLDYLLWQRIQDKQELVCGDRNYVEARLIKFSFTFRSSVEHHYPQNPIHGALFGTPVELPKGVDSFGNLCLISQSQNSRLNNSSPEAKKRFYQNGQRPESLKQILMMSYQEWTPESAKEITEHEVEMIEVLCEQKHAAIDSAN